VYALETTDYSSQQSFDVRIVAVVRIVDETFAHVLLGRNRQRAACSIACVLAVLAAVVPALPAHGAGLAKVRFRSEAHACFYDGMAQYDKPYAVTALTTSPLIQRYLQGLKSTSRERTRRRPATKIESLLSAIGPHAAALLHLEILVLCVARFWPKHLTGRSIFFPTLAVCGAYLLCSVLYCIRDFLIIAHVCMRSACPM